MEKHMSSDALCDIAEVVLKNNFFKFGKKTLKQKTRTAIRTNLHLLIEEEILRKAEFKPYLW